MTERRDRVYRVFRLYQDDRERLRTLHEVTAVEDRHHALLNLVDIVENMDIPDIRERERQSIRIGIPVELHETIQRRADETGQTYVDILMMAVRNAAE